MNTRTLLVHTVLAGTAACTAERAPVQLDALSQAEREAFFLTAIRDSGFICEGVMHLQPIADDGSAWRISCIDITAYLATVEPDGSVTVSPAPYVESPTLRGPPVRIEPPRD